MHRHQRRDGNLLVHGNRRRLPRRHQLPDLQRRGHRGPGPRLHLRAAGADDVLEGGPYRCYDDYLVQVDRFPPYGNGPWLPAVFTSSSDLNKSYLIRVFDPSNGNFVAKPSSTWKTTCRRRWIAPPRPCWCPAISTCRRRIPRRRRLFRNMQRMNPCPKSFRTIPLKSKYL